MLLWLWICSTTLPFTHIIPAEFQHGSYQGKLLIDLFALQIRKHLFQTISDPIHGHVSAEYHTEGEHVKKDSSLHGQFLIAWSCFLLGHTVLKRSIVKIHLVHLQRESEKIRNVRNKE